MSLHGDQIRSDQTAWVSDKKRMPGLAEEPRRARTGYRRGVGGSHTMLPTDTTHRDRHPDVIHQHHLPRSLVHGLCANEPQTLLFFRRERQSPSEPIRSGAEGLIQESRRALREVVYGVAYRDS